MASDDAPHDYECFWLPLLHVVYVPTRRRRAPKGGKIRPGTRRHMASEVVSRLDREAACWGIGTYR